MKLSHPDLSEPIAWEGGGIIALILESPSLFRRWTEELIAEEAGDEGAFVLSDGEILRFDKAALLFTDPFRADVSGNKKLLTALYKSFAELTLHELQEPWTALEQEVQQFLSDLAYRSGEDLTWSDGCDLAAFWKWMEVRPDLDALPLVERLLAVMDLSARYLGTRLFCVWQFASCLTAEEMRQLQKEVTYRKLSVLLIEPHVASSLAEVEKRIIDADLCEL